MKKKDPVYAEILETTDYDIFQPVIHNRQHNRSKGKYKELKNSIAKHGMLVPIVCTFRNGKFEVGDGFGRLSAAKELNVPVRYFFHLSFEEEEKRSLITDINNTQTRWTLHNYLEWYIENPEYAFISRIATLYPSVSISDIIYVFGEQNTSAKFIKGTFKSLNRAKNEAIIMCLSQLSQYKITKYRRTKTAIVQVCREDYPIPMVAQAIRDLSAMGICVSDYASEIKELIENRVIFLLKAKKNKKTAVLQDAN